MYFFLSDLSLLNFCFTTSIIPQLRWKLRGPSKTITVAGSTLPGPGGFSLATRLNTTIQATVIFCLPRCGHWRLLHFFCEMPAMLKLACVDVRTNEIQVFVGILVTILLSLSLITVSYGSIARAVLRIKSPWVWRKVLGTCGAHLLVVTLFCGSIMMVYIRPNNSFTGTLDRFLTLFYTVVTPTLNPLI
ncbi:olfactory receptor 2G3-like [Tachyglossus aculeatus]|uniref:olfactory receptor 2G3-like n=1 Tax=Tachyglossus aculeatus TaxID=9261 RepID=UPI0018F61220|nr:olfactory receptor 2G3-like [Tachyglossus aculeatus]